MKKVRQSSKRSWVCEDLQQREKCFEKFSKLNFWGWFVKRINKCKKQRSKLQLIIVYCIN